ncbi:drebrin-like protein [Diachasma alloeum]|uniref:drebrin-like protein n=1 Tax=Diachasma alloeum TaxID=454923 RepID=UPI0007383788|nr:drebrin-like protein [Diachasma alloeum]
MSVNLSKNNESLVAAWTSVVDDKSPVNWAVFGYEGQTNNLKVVSTGNGGLEEMIEDLNSGHIMYAFCRVIDTKTSLPKCVLVNWQGELAPIVRKGTCANHIRDIERLLKGAHIQVNARSEEDVEVDMIMEKLARATGSAYKFQAPRSKDVGNTLPVGTTYKRVIPAQEINATERDEFWQKEELEEKARVEQERIRRERERQRLELETRSREEKQSKIREEEATPVVRKIEQSEQRVQELKNLRNHLQRADSDDEEPKSKSEELRRQRSNEAQQLIAQRTINARAVFEQNSAAGQMRSGFTPGKAASRVTRVERASEGKPQQVPQEVEEIKTPEVVKDQPQDVKETLDVCKDAPVEVIVDEREAKPEERKPTEEISTVENELYNQLSGENYLYFDPNNEGMKARALYDYQAADDTEITFDPGDVITHIDAIDEGWWQGLAPDGTYGLFPANYVEVIEYAST